MIPASRRAGSAVGRAATKHNMSTATGILNRQLGKLKEQAVHPKGDACYTTKFLHLWQFR